MFSSAAALVGSSRRRHLHRPYAQLHHDSADGATGSSAWWIEHADHHMPILMSTDGPFARSDASNKPGEPLPYTAPPDGLFPDVRKTSLHQ